MFSIKILSSLVVWWLGLDAFIAHGPGSVPDWGTEIPQALVQPKNKNKNNSINKLATWTHFEYIYLNHNI